MLKTPPSSPGHSTLASREGSPPTRPGSGEAAESMAVARESAASSRDAAGVARPAKKNAKKTSQEFTAQQETNESGDDSPAT